MIFLFLILPLVCGKVYERCELARELQTVHKAPPHQLAVWVCIAEHESNYRTFAVGRLGEEGTADHGIFQINDRYWCSRPEEASCNLSCEDLLDDDITDDFQCVQKIYREHKILSGDGFNAWAVYKPHCKGSKSAKYLKGCFGGVGEVSKPSEVAFNQSAVTTAYTRGRVNPFLGSSTPSVRTHSVTILSTPEFSPNSTVRPFKISATNPFLQNIRTTTIKPFSYDPVVLTNKPTTQSLFSTTRSPFSGSTSTTPSSLFNTASNPTTVKPVPTPASLKNSFSRFGYSNGASFPTARQPVPTPGNQKVSFLGFGYSNSVSNPTTGQPVPTPESLKNSFSGFGYSNIVSNAVTRQPVPTPASLKNSFSGFGYSNVVSNPTTRQPVPTPASLRNSFAGFGYSNSVANPTTEQPVPTPASLKSSFARFGYSNVVSNPTPRQPVPTPASLRNSFSGFGYSTSTPIPNVRQPVPTADSQKVSFLATGYSNSVSYPTTRQPVPTPASLKNSFSGFRFSNTVSNPTTGQPALLSDNRFSGNAVRQPFQSLYQSTTPRTTVGLSLSNANTFVSSTTPRPVFVFNGIKWY